MHIEFMSSGHILFNAFYFITQVVYLNLLFPWGPRVITSESESLHLLNTTLLFLSHRCRRAFLYLLYLRFLFLFHGFMVKICTSALPSAFTIFFIHPPIATSADYPQQDKAFLVKFCLRGIDGWGEITIQCWVVFIRRRIF